MFQILRIRFTKNITFREKNTRYNKKNLVCFNSLKLIVKTNMIFLQHSSEKKKSNLFQV